MPDLVGPNEFVGVFHRTISALVRRNGPDLTARQLTILLACYLGKESPTITSLTEELDVPRSSISRAIERLVQLRFARRKTDPNDHRNVWIVRTPRGHLFMSHLSLLTAEAMSTANAGDLSAQPDRRAKPRASRSH